uniref:Uncharacterized protein n=1 Tax=Arundo donax TaxID=35708 RepID=A0A0A9HBK9_ARUDO
MLHYSWIINCSVLVVQSFNLQRFQPTHDAIGNGFLQLSYDGMEYPCNVLMFLNSFAAAAV